MDEDARKNSFGEVISGPVKLQDPAYGTGALEINGDPKVDWEGHRADFADEDGFDIRNNEANGAYYIEMQLPKGTQLIRYGRETGKYTAPKGTAYEKLSLPYDQRTVEYHEYTVIADSVTVFCPVKKGTVAPMFGSSGGGIQYLHLNGSIRKLVKNSVLKRI